MEDLGEKPLPCGFRRDNEGLDQPGARATDGFDGSLAARQFGIPLGDKQIQGSIDRLTGEPGDYAGVGVFGDIGDLPAKVQKDTWYLQATSASILDGEHASVYGAQPGRAHHKQRKVEGPDKAGYVQVVVEWHGDAAGSLDYQELVQARKLGVGRKDDFGGDLAPLHLGGDRRGQRLTQPVGNDEVRRVVYPGSRSKESCISGVARRIRVRHAGLGGFHHPHVYTAFLEEGSERGPDEGLADPGAGAGYEDTPQRTSRKARSARSMSESVWVAIAVTRSLLVP